MTSTTAPARRYTVAGVTDESDACECCGRTNLKRVVVLRDNGTGDFVRMGTGCAARAEGIPASRITSEVKAVEARNRAALTAIRRFPAAAAEAIFIRWAVDTGAATVDRFGNVHPTGDESVWNLRKRYRVEA